MQGTQVNSDGKRVPIDVIDAEPDEVRPSTIQPDSQIAVDGRRHPQDQLSGVEKPPTAKQLKEKGVSPLGSGEQTDDAVIEGDDEDGDEKDRKQHKVQRAPGRKSSR